MRDVGRVCVCVCVRAPCNCVYIAFPLSGPHECVYEVYVLGVALVCNVFVRV